MTTLEDKIRNLVEEWDERRLAITRIDPNGSPVSVTEYDVLLECSLELRSLLGDDHLEPF